VSVDIDGPDAYGPESAMVLEAGGVEIVNRSGVPTQDIMRSLYASNGRLMAEITSWTATTQGGTARRNGGIFERDRYVTPSSVFDQMKLAYSAVENDDVVSGVLESTEGLALSKVSMYSEDMDTEDVYNQVAGDIELDSRLREMWRELFTVSQFVMAVWWGTKTYKLSGKTEKGVRRKREVTVRAPQALTLLDPLKVIPVGTTLFNQEQLVYCADRFEAGRLEDPEDPLVARMFLGRYEPSTDERRWISDLGISVRDLFLLNPATVFRHTATRPQFQRFANVRLKSTFELLDLKHQLRSMDRAHLIGGTNFIVLITKGTDDLPAKPEEIANLQAQVRTVAKVPVLVGDHRLSVEIVTPKLDTTLKPERYDVLDMRIQARLFQMFMRESGRGDTDSTKLAKVIARGLESRRHMLRRTLEKQIWGPMFEQNELLVTPAKLRFHPSNIALDFDQAFAQWLADRRSEGEISRETLLSEFDLDQDDEARMREREADRYDDIFKTAVPFDAPANNQSRTGQEPAPVDEGEGEGTSRAKQRRQGRTGGGTKDGGGAPADRRKTT
jgi:hypothetical protein